MFDARSPTIFFIGSILLRIVRVHHWSRNFTAQAGLAYSQNRWKSSRKRWLRTLCRLYCEQFGQLHRLLLRAVLGTLQQAPAGMLQHRLVAVLRQAVGLAAADLVNRLVHLLHDVEAVQDVDGLLQLLGNHVQVGLPHVATDKTDRLRTLAR